MNTPSEKTIVVGRIGSSYGVKGWAKIQSFTVPVDNILDYQPWLVWHKSKWETMEIREARAHGNGIIAKIPNCKNCEEVKLYANAEISVYRSQLPKLPDDEYYCNDFIGLKVLNQQGLELGIIEKVIQTGANDVLHVKGEKEMLIPYLPHVILKVNLIDKTLLVDWDNDF
ncbi:MAG: ribosome maturation factor RimM [Proteobacteria bacterium]|nr:ribosome maturation factor RimM [Pseudomonadota bacterium]